MKKKVIYTQRVEIVEGYNERRDCADQNIAVFLEACGYIPVSVPNVLADLDGFVETVDSVGIVLTGGNSLVKYGGTRRRGMIRTDGLSGLRWRKGLVCMVSAEGCSRF